MCRKNRATVMFVCPVCGGTHYVPYPRRGKLTRCWKNGRNVRVPMDAEISKRVSSILRGRKKAPKKVVFHPNKLDHHVRRRHVRSAALIA